MGGGRRNDCLARIAGGGAIGCAVGGAVGAVYGTYEAIRYKVHSRDHISRYIDLALVTFALFSASVSDLLDILDTPNETLIYKLSWPPEITERVPGLLKIRHVGQTTLGSAAVFGLFLGAGSLIHCGKSY